MPENRRPYRRLPQDCQKNLRPPQNSDKKLAKLLLDFLHNYRKNLALSWTHAWDNAIANQLRDCPAQL